MTLRVPRAVRRTTALLAGATLLLGGLTSCVLLEGPTPTAPERTTSTTQTDTADGPAVYVPDGTADDNLPYFQQTLAQYAASESPVQGQPIVDALAAAGFEKANMQVSFDQSRTNLVADNIFVSVRFGESCVIGQFVTESRELFTVVEDALSAEKNICLIGTTRPIDW